MWVRGLKRVTLKRQNNAKMSHPMWVRGLKLVSNNICKFLDESHPMWVRGLKLQIHTSKRRRRHVAPYVGAWIETSRYDQPKKSRRRTLCGCVD